jgi:hypothetical protein
MSPPVNVFVICIIAEKRRRGLSNEDSNQDSLLEEGQAMAMPGFVPGQPPFG